MSTNKIIMQQKNSSGTYDALLPKTYGGSFINVVAEKNASLSLSGPNSYSQSYTLSSIETQHGFPVTDDGSYTITVTFSDSTVVNKTITKSGDGLFSYIISVISSVLNENSWAKISKASSDGTASSLWSVGDVKMDTISGTVGIQSISGSYGFYIVDFDHNSSREGTGITFMGFKTAISGGVDVGFVDSNYDSLQTTGFIMNPKTSSDIYGTNVGGWASSYMRNTVIPTFKNALSSELKAVLKSTTIYTDNVGGGTNVESNISATTDTIYLPSEFEIQGSRTWANQYEQNYQTQFAYYKNGGSKIKYKYSGTSSSVYWWLRSPICYSSGDFCHVYTSGDANYNYAATSLSFAPSFKV